MCIFLVWLFVLPQLFSKMGRTVQTKRSRTYQVQGQGGATGKPLQWGTKPVHLRAPYQTGPRKYGYGIGETKYFDVGIRATVTSGSADWTASEVPCDNYVNSSGTAAAYTDSALIPSAPGVSYGQVSGNRYKLKKIRVRGILQFATLPDQADVSLGKRFRLMLVYDSSPNGAQAQGEDVMQDVGADETLFSFKRMAAQGSRFRILKDQIGILENHVAGTDGSNVNSLGFMTHSFSFQYAPKDPISVSVKSAAAASAPSIGNLVDGNIFLLLQTNSSAINIVGSSRCYYNDK